MTNYYIKQMRTYREKLKKDLSLLDRTILREHYPFPKPKERPEIENEFHFNWEGSREQRKEKIRQQIISLCVAKKVGFYNEQTKPTRAEVSANITELRKELIQTI